MEETSIPEPDGRAALVSAAAQRWRGQLIDVGGRNTLLYYRDLKVGTLDLGAAAPVPLAALLDGRTVPLAQLYPDADAHTQAVRRARVIRNKARELREERGIETCFLAIGMATWTRPQGNSGSAVPAAPVLLRSATIRARGAAEEDFDLTLTGDVEVNPTLLHVLATDFDVLLDAEELAELEPALLFERLAKEAADRVHGFTVSHRQVLGTFSYAKLPMVTDLVAGADTLLGHEVVAAIAGDREAQARLRERSLAGAEVDPATPDRVPPADEFIVLDADSSQEYAINAILAGQHAVVKGPPGTGKSQTIANLIASLTAHGKRVLFVAEKRAAISAVTDRLARAGLDHLVMDVHDGTSTRRRIARELKSALDQASRIALPDLTDLHERLADRRARLAGYDEALHTKREPWGVSVFAARAGLLAATPVEARLRGPALTALDQATTRRVREELREYVSLGGLRDSAWSGARVASAESAQAAYDLVGRLRAETLPAGRAEVARVVAETGLAEPTRLRDWKALFELLDGVRATLSRFDGAVYARPELVAATASRGWRQAHPDFPGARAGWLARRALRREARGLWRGGGRPSRGTLFEGLLTAHEQGQRWARASRTGQAPCVPSGLGNAHAALAADLAALDDLLPVDVWALRLGAAADLVERLASDVGTLRRLPRINELAARFAGLGLDPVLVAARRADADPETLASMFDHCWYASILDHVSFTDPRVGAFDGPMHSRTASDYRASDHAHIASTATRVQRAVAEHVVAARDAYPEESRLVERQANLKRRHLPIRQLFAAAPHMMTALKPCWAMSPLVVSQLLPADGQYFDVVVFDEASQVTPADAVPAIMRARQVVVAGDEHQLPPTTFFTAADEHDDSPLGITPDGAIDPALTSGYESVLDVLSALLRGYTLRWHYRSLDERLIAFSNAWIYDRSLVTFPGAVGADCVSFVGVSGVAESTMDSVDAEVSRVVSLVLSHAAERPDESLGVITMGVVHADRISSALRSALRSRPELHEFFDENRPEPFFVKNLERVQGDERDAVILSIGYGKTADGRLLYRFGPLLLPGGHRRLNVAVTRARRRMTLVCSFRSVDLDPSRTTAEGVRLLRAYLEYAESGGLSLGAAATAKPALNAFEVDVQNRLTAAGIPVTAQYGVAGYFVDFAAAHPTRPGEMVLAIEADGASYHSSGTVRDRDRLRQEHLERLGWSFHRIWSTDWFTDPAAEVERVRAAYLAAVAAADARLGIEPSPVSPAPSLEESSLEDPELVAVDPTPTVRLSDLGRAGPRPPVPAGQPIGAYTQQQLVELIRWIESDTLLRTEEQLLDEVMSELGFQRKGPRIREAVLTAVRSARSWEF